jgi:hypothetical protein
MIVRYSVYTLYQYCRDISRMLVRYSMSYEGGVGAAGLGLGLGLLVRHTAIPG